MGMDVYGKANPEAYFRAGAGSWGDIWMLTDQIAPELTRLVQYSGTNDGDGLSGEAALALADKMRAALEDGTLERLFIEHLERCNAIPDETCRWCNGTGTRTDDVGVRMGMVERKWCNGCDGKGRHRPWNAVVVTDMEHLREWVAFLQVSGGFEIW